MPSKTEGRDRLVRLMFDHLLDPGVCAANTFDHASRTAIDVFDIDDHDRLTLLTSTEINDRINNITGQRQPLDGHVV